METIGKNNAVCNEYPSPILPKERWRYQMVNMYPDSGQCHPFGRSGEYVSGQRAVPSVRAQCDALGDGKKSAQHKEKLRLPDVA
ncbi:hypothetical protein WG3_04749 [Escherichia coli KTE36]|nr:hypothetical protein WG3_04749 [Escherichia coli KTE36]